MARGSLRKEIFRPHHALVVERSSNFPVRRFVEQQVIVQVTRVSCVEATEELIGNDIVSRVANICAAWDNRGCLVNAAE